MSRWGTLGVVHIGGVLFSAHWRCVGCWSQSGRAPVFLAVAPGVRNFVACWQLEPIGESAMVLAVKLAVAPGGNSE